MRQGPTIAVAAALLCALALRLWLASRWGLIADEAYHWVWSLQPALGYYDQPPLIAWVLAAARAGLGESTLALRAAPIALGIASIASLVPYARDRSLWLVWALGLPPLWLMTQLAVPDALLIAAWGGALAAAIRGGRAWVLAGILAGLASLAKHTGLGLMPLLLLGADASERRTPWPWVGWGLSLALVAPNLAWNASHDWVTLRFQFSEGLASPNAPGWVGPIEQGLGQALFATPLAFAAAVAWAVRWPGDRVDRLCWASSVPLLVFFALAAVGGPPEAHWTAPAWVGVGLGLSRSSGRVHRLAAVGAWLAAFASLAATVHAERPLLALEVDPADRLREGEALGRGVARWALPTGVARWEDAVRQATPVVTERYQEAALVHYYTGIEARVLPGCGRPSQYDLWPFEVPDSAMFVRPSRSGPPACAEARFGELPRPAPIRGGGGRWDLFVVSR